MVKTENKHLLSRDDSKVEHHNVGWKLYFIGQCKVDDGVKLTRQNDYEFLDKTFLKLYNSQSLSMKAKYKHINVIQHM